MILHFNKQFKDGALKAIELFKVVFDVNKNVIISEKEKLHINNTELLITERTFDDKDYQFGFNFVIENIEKYRERLCINPIFYLLFLEYILSSNLTKCHLNSLKSSVNAIKKLFNDYCASSQISSARPDFDELNIITQELVKDDFLKEILRHSYGSKYIMIQEGYENHIYNNPFYFLRCTKYGKLNVYNDIESVVWFSTITDKELQNFIDFCTLNHKRIAVFFNSAEKSVFQKLKDISFFVNDVVFFHYPGLSFYDIMKDINILSGKKNTDNFYDNSFGQIYDYSFGKLKMIKFEEGTAKILGCKKYDDYKQYLGYLKTTKSMERISMLRGDSVIVCCKEDLIEASRVIVSLAKSIYTKGIFYDEITTLQLFLFYFTKTDLTNYERMFIISMLQDILKKILILYGCQNYQDILSNAYDGKLDKIFNPLTKQFQVSKRYTSREMYDLTFDYLLADLSLFLSIGES